MYVLSVCACVHVCDRVYVQCKEVHCRACGVLMCQYVKIAEPIYILRCILTSHWIEDIITLDILALSNYSSSIDTFSRLSGLRLILQ